jgi:uncharacterized protein YbcI
MLAAVSNAVVRAYRDALGRGPTRVRSHSAHVDLLVCVLQDTLTPAERRLLTLGQHAEVRAARAVLSHSMEADLRLAVQDAAQRRVSVVVSGYDPWTDTATELFMLEAHERDGGAGRR